jgi:hypothetical protein
MTHPGDEPQDAPDLTAIAADDALLDSLGSPEAALTWDGTVDEPQEITDALVWTDEPVRRPTGNPVKKQRSQSDDAAERLLSLVLADAALDAETAISRMCATADVEPAALPGVTWGKATPGVTWGRLARRTGTRGAAALAAVAVSLGGVAAASVVAGPSSPLYPVHKLFAGPNPVDEQAYAVSRVSAALDEAQAALAAHKPGLAHGKLSVAQARLKAVTAGTAKDGLTKRYDDLTAQVAAATPEVTTSATPAPTAPSTSAGSTGSSETSTSATPSPSDSTSDGHGNSNGNGQGANGNGQGSSGPGNSGGKGSTGGGNSGGNSSHADGKGSGNGTQPPSGKAPSTPGGSHSGRSGAGSKSSHNGHATTETNPATVAKATVGESASQRAKNAPQNGSQD